VSAKYGYCLVFLSLCAAPVSACDLKVTDAWIREAPPGLMTLAGYASLTNTGNQALHLTDIHSSVFAEVQAHETVMENGMASMRAVKSLDIAPHQTLMFKPGGLHFMMMGASKTLHQGDVVQVQLKDQKGCSADVAFTVRAMQ